MIDQSIAADADMPPREYGPLCDWVGRKIALHLQALEPAVYAKEVSTLAKRPELLDDLTSSFHSMLMLKLLESKRERRIKRNKKAGAASPVDDPAIRNIDAQIDETGNELAYWALEATLTRVEEEVRRDVKQHARKQLPGIKSMVHTTRLLEAIHGLFPDSLHQMLLSDLLALQLGGPVTLLKKQPTASHGDGSKRRQLQVRALEHIAFRRGTGMKEERAQEIVAAAYDIDMDTIRQWRKRLREGREAYMEIHLEEVFSHGGLLAEFRELKADAHPKTAQKNSKTPEFTAAHEVLVATSEKQYGDEALAHDGQVFGPYRHGAKKAKA